MATEGQAEKVIETLVVRLYGTHGLGERVLASRIVRVRVEKTPEGTTWFAVGQYKPIIYRAKYWTRVTRVAVSASRELTALGVKEVVLPGVERETLKPFETGKVLIPFRLIRVS